MQGRDVRAAILTLHEKGNGLRAIARALGISRNTVRRVLTSGSAEVPDIERTEKAEPHEERIRALFVLCKGNLVRVHEELATAGVILPYSTLTGFCRRRSLGQEPKERAGEYHFTPGQEMQHDTSPHDVTIGSRLRRVQCASLVLGYSRRIFAQVYPTWNRFWAKVFLTDAFRAFEGTAGRCVIDNSSIIVASGNGRDAIMAPEMVAFATRFGGFDWLAHELGDADRSARVERPFHHIEHNFYVGRTFTDVVDLNAQFIVWCDKVNATPKKRLGTTPIALFATEQTSLRPLPLHVPEIYALHRRSVDLEGYISLHTNRYSLPAALIDRELAVHETKSRVRLFDGHRLVCEHAREEDGAGKRSTLPEHEREGRWHRRDERPASAEEIRLRADSPIMARMVDAIQKRHGGRATRRLGRLYRLWLDYPPEPLRCALSVAIAHGLSDLDRIEVLVLRHIAGDFFRLRKDDDDDKDDS